MSSQLRKIGEQQGGFQRNTIRVGNIEKEEQEKIPSPLEWSNQERQDKITDIQKRCQLTAQEWQETAIIAQRWMHCPDRFCLIFGLEMDQQIDHLEEVVSKKLGSSIFQTIRASFYTAFFILYQWNESTAYGYIMKHPERHDNSIDQVKMAFNQLTRQIAGEVVLKKRKQASGEQKRVYQELKERKNKFKQTVDLFLKINCAAECLNLFSKRASFFFLHKEQLNKKETFASLARYFHFCDRLFRTNYTPPTGYFFLSDPISVPDSFLNVAQLLNNPKKRNIEQRIKALIYETQTSGMAQLIDYRNRCKQVKNDSQAQQNASSVLKKNGLALIDFTISQGELAIDNYCILPKYPDFSSMESLANRLLSFLENAKEYISIALKEGFLSAHYADKNAYLPTVDFLLIYHKLIIPIEDMCQAGLLLIWDKMMRGNFFFTCKAYHVNHQINSLRATLSEVREIENFLNKIKGILRDLPRQLLDALQNERIIFPDDVSPEEVRNSILSHFKTVSFNSMYKIAEYIAFWEDLEVLIEGKFSLEPHYLPTEVLDLFLLPELTAWVDAQMPPRPLLPLIPNASDQDFVELAQPVVKEIGEGKEEEDEFPLDVENKEEKPQEMAMKQMAPQLNQPSASDQKRREIMASLKLVRERRKVLEVLHQLGYYTSRGPGHKNAKHEVLVNGEGNLVVVPRGSGRDNIALGTRMSIANQAS